MQIAIAEEQQLLDDFRRANQIHTKTVAGKIWYFHEGGTGDQTVVDGVWGRGAMVCMNARWFLAFILG